MKVRNPPGNGKDIAESKGVHREVGYPRYAGAGPLKEAGFGEPTNPRANLWPDEQKSHRRLQLRISLPFKMKSNNYTEAVAVDVAGR